MSVLAASPTSVVLWCHVCRKQLQDQSWADMGTLRQRRRIPRVRTVELRDQYQSPAIVLVKLVDAGRRAAWSIFHDASLRRPAKITSSNAVLLRRLGGDYQQVAIIKVAFRFIFDTVTVRAVYKTKLITVVYHLLYHFYHRRCVNTFPSR